MLRGGWCCGEAEVAPPFAVAEAGGHTPQRKEDGAVRVENALYVLEQAVVDERFWDQDVAQHLVRVRAVVEDNALEHCLACFRIQREMSTVGMRPLLASASR